MHWALKTTWGAEGTCEWPMFVRESVVAIGWHGISVDPSAVSEDELIDEVNRVYPLEGRNGARCLRRFVSFAVNDLILVCRGYRRATGNPIQIYGFARITGPFICEPPGQNQWRFKHKANIQQIDKRIPRELVVNALRRRAMGRTVHDISDVGIEPLSEAIGVPIVV